MQALLTVWKFSRPHTIIGTVTSVCTLYAMACHGDEWAHIPLLLTAILIGLGCNIFIVGINQVADVEIDRINKPYLPIPAGLLNLKQAKVLVYGSLLTSLLLALYLSPYLFLVILSSAFIGWAYSMPPLYLKRHHLPAALAISTVRGVLVNLGGFMVFNWLINHERGIPENMKILSMFIVMFSIVIAWFKDLPDMEGDAKYSIRTLAILYTPRVTLLLGNTLIAIAYLGTVLLKYRQILSGFADFSTQVLFYGHILLFALFLMNSFSISLQEKKSIKAFYKRFWWFFFGEYILYLIAYL